MSSMYLIHVSGWYVCVLRNACSNLCMNSVAKAGAIFVPIAVPVICWKNSPLYSNVLYCRMYVMSISMMSFGGLCGRSNCCSVSMHALIPSVCGILVYRLVTSIVSSIVCGGRCMDSIRLINCLLSLM